MGRNGAPRPSVVRGAPAEQCHAYGKSLRSLAGCKESQLWSCIASTGLARQEVDDSKEVASLAEHGHPEGAARALQQLFVAVRLCLRPESAPSAHSLPARRPPAMHDVVVLAPRAARAMVFPTLRSCVRVEAATQ